MDADGEDRPEDIPRLLEAMGNAGHPTAVFAERGRRLENLTFRVMYRCYSLLHWVFTGRDIRFGNFSVLPWSYLDSLVVCPELWNHYSATFLKSRLPYTRVRCDRGRRLAGESRMNFVSLVIHGMSALFANQEVVGTRLLLMAVFTTLISVLLLGMVVGIRIFTHATIPAGAVVAVGSSIRPRRSVSAGMFHAGFFRHDDSQPPRLSPDTRLFLLCGPRNRTLLHGPHGTANLYSRNCRAFHLGGPSRGSALSRLRTARNRGAR